MLEANQVDGIISGRHNLGFEDYNRVTARHCDRTFSPLEILGCLLRHHALAGALAAEVHEKQTALPCSLLSRGERS